jgi:signal peptidase I
LENQPDNLPAEPEKKSRSKIVVSTLLEILKMLALAVVLYFLIDFMLGRERVKNISMEPTLVQGDILFVNQIVYKFKDMEYGEIITLHYPLNPEEEFVKRVIGLPGDVIDVHEGNVWVNGSLLYEPYISAPSEYEGTWIVPADNLFVLGDNRNRSSDSHVWGFVPEENVVGKAFAIYWPINRIRGLATPDIYAH